MRTWIFIFLMLLVAGCSKTQVVRYYNGEVVPEINQEPIQEQKSEIVSPSSDIITQPNRFNGDNNGEDNSASAQSSSGNQVSTVQVNSNETSNEYTITSCCNYGKMEVKVDSKESDFTIEQVKELLFNIYKDNCNRFSSNPKHSLYIVFSEYLEGNSRNHLSSFVNPYYNELVIKGKFQKPDFKNCLS